jgi:GntR family transcriptional repressor for pyruvate dehydrogenase complex
MLKGTFDEASPDFPLKRSNLYEQIADTIEKAILGLGEEGLFEDGQDKLPSEQALARKFGVSRTVVREGLKLVKERGLVELRTGEGSYITKPRPEAISKVISRMILMESVSDDEIYALRAILEVGACRLAAVNASPEDRAQLASLLSAMGESLDNTERLVHLDAEFHTVIARASGNKLLRILVEANTVLLREYMAKSVIMPGAKADGMLRHRIILEAIVLGDPEKAETAMKTHLEASRAFVAKFAEAGGKVENRLAMDET